MIRVGHSTENVSTLRRIALNPVKAETVAENRRGGEAQESGLGLGVSASDTPTLLIKMRLPCQTGLRKTAGASIAGNGKAARGAHTKDMRSAGLTRADADNCSAGESLAAYRMVDPIERGGFLLNYRAVQRPPIIPPAP